MTIFASEIVRMAKEGYCMGDIARATRCGTELIQQICAEKNVEIIGYPIRKCKARPAAKPEETPKAKALQKPKEESHIRYVERQAANDVPPVHPLVAARPGTGPLEYAEIVLRHERLLVNRNGVEFVNGKYATLLLKLREANRALKRRGMDQIEGDPGWRV